MVDFFDHTVDLCTATQFSELISEDNFSPILNRAIQGTYAPGSTFKVVTALAALQEGVLGEGEDALRSPDALYNDEGSYTYSGCFQDSSTCRFSSPFTGSRWVDLRGAIRVSSDTYFYEIAGEGFWFRSAERGEDGLRPDEGIQKWARAIGLGTDSGIQLPYERSGAVPDRAYYDSQYDLGVFAVDGSQWFAGATINLSIGQGELLVTPLQLAMADLDVPQPDVLIRMRSFDKPNRYGSERGRRPREATVDGHWPVDRRSPLNFMFKEGWD